MPLGTRAVVAVLIISPLLSVAAGQTTTSAASSLNLSGLTTTPLGIPTAPSSVTGVGSCAGTGGGRGWGWTVAAVDAAGGTTQPSTQFGTTNGNCTSLDATDYFWFTVPAAPGAASCAIYRTAFNNSTSGSNIGLLGYVLCNMASPFFDVGNNPIGPVPQVNTTGSVSASGNVSAPTFQATGIGSSGTSVWASGSQLTGCGTSLSPVAPPCIVTMGEFFLNAPSSIPTSYGWTAPMAANSGNQLLYIHPPGTTVGGIAPSALDYITSDTTTTHALFATSGAPAFRALVGSDLPNPSSSTFQRWPQTTRPSFPCALRSERMNRCGRVWWSWRGKSRASGIGGCMCCCDEVENR
jgi:hypothetical protein